MNRPKPPLITTILPTYRRPNLLRRAIMSVLSQTYPHFQVCVYDNASNDETASVVAEIAKKDPRVKYHAHAKNIGGMQNFQYGLEHVETPFFSFLSDDDVMLPDFYQTAMEGFETFPDAMFSAGLAITMNEKGEVIEAPLSSWKREGYYTPPDGMFQMMGGRHQTWTGTLFRREAVDKIGLLDLEVGFPADIDYQLRIGARFPFVVSKEPCAIFIVHDLSLGASADSSKIWPGWLKIIRNISEDTRLSPEVRMRSKRMLREDLANQLFSAWMLDMKLKNFKDAYRIAGILRDEFQRNALSIAMYAATKMCERAPISYHGFNSLIKAYKLMKRNETQALQEKFGAHARSLEL